MKTVRVLIIDDSALVRQILSEILSSDPAIDVVDTAADPYVARERIKKLNPDVLTLDVEMPRMDGITFLGNLMRLRPTPVIMVSSLTEGGADITLRALELGAVDFVTKPKLDIARGLEEYGEELCEKVKVAAEARIRGGGAGRHGVGVGQESTVAASRTAARFGGEWRTTDRIVAIGASTGGTEAIREVLTRLPADGPGVVVAQHIPAAFSAPFARRMDGCSALNVCEAEDGQPICPGHVYIAPGGVHLEVKRDGARYRCVLRNAAPVNRHRPSVDVLFHSVVEQVGSSAIGVILTGMGSDGAVGLKEMREAGLPTIAQDERTSVVWGMPGAAVELGAAGCVLPLEEIPGAIMHLAAGRDATSVVARH